MTMVRISIYDAEGTCVAFAEDGGEWQDPFGGIFRQRDRDDLDAFAAGRIDDYAFGCPGLRLVVSGLPVPPRSRERAILKALREHPDPAIRATAERIAKVDGWTAEDLRAALRDALGAQ